MKIDIGSTVGEKIVETVVDLGRPSGDNYVKTITVCYFLEKYKHLLSYFTAEWRQILNAYLKNDRLCVKYYMSEGRST